MEMRTSMSQMVESTEKCAVCGGSEGEHANSQHMFTTKPGELITKEQHAKQQQQQQPQKIAIPYQGGPLGKLIEVLVTKKLLTLDDALYIAELGPRPDLSEYEGSPRW